MLASITLAMLLATGSVQPGGAPHRPITRHLEQTAFDAEPAAMTIRVGQGSTRDPLRNGARIGAIVGGTIMAAAMTWLCVTLHEEGDPSCVGPVLFWTAAGAGAGALAGAGIDALFGRRIVLQGSVRF